MSKTLMEISKQLSLPVTHKKTVAETTKEVEETKSVPKVQLIYAFNGIGKTRLSREFKQLIAPKNAELEEDEPRKVLYYNAFTEDLFYWDNDLENDLEPKMRIQPNEFTNWIFKEQGQDQNIIANFHRYVDDKLTPSFNPNFTEVTFSLERGDNSDSSKRKISKGEESSFVWSVFYTLLEQVIGVLNIAEPGDRDTKQFNKLDYVFIDDPVSSLDENHLIELAVDVATLIKSSKSEVKFIITTHNPLFYNVLYNELKDKQNKFVAYRLEKLENGMHQLIKQDGDSPFSYHLYLISELEKAISSEKIYKYHFNFLRNILEKTSTFLGHDKWSELLPKDNDDKTNPYEARIINISSHSKHSGEEVAELKDDDKRVLKYLVKYLNETYHFHNKKRVNK